MAAASGALVAAPAHADSAADGSAARSPGVISGNVAQLPVHLPVNACGNTVSVVGLLNPAAGNTCTAAGASAGARGGSDDAVPDGAAGGAPGTSEARSETKGSPGVLSGNGLQLPVDLPVQASGNTVNVVGVLNPAIGNTATTGTGDRPELPGSPDRPETPEPRPTSPPRQHPVTEPAAAAPVASRQPVMTLAHTGADLTAPGVLGSAALILGGAALYRRFRPGAQR
ncbi:MULTISPECIES: chaplin family protein [unclassified Streptomyces]|uniref:chaplin n=1 Tax=unclassified Streptomyces TaxID=2593676 RepID=UPI0027E3FC45|nr:MULTISPECIES: chaplin family protein [unclassified Streptomyces]